VRHHQAGDLQIDENQNKLFIRLFCSFVFTGAVNTAIVVATRLLQERQPKMAEPRTRKALLDAFGYVTEAYPVDMRSEDDYGPYNIIFLGSAGYNFKENMTSMQPTGYHIKKDWNNDLKETTCGEMENLKNRYTAVLTKGSCSGKVAANVAANEIGISIDNTNYQLKDLVIVNGECKSVPNEAWEDVPTVFQSNVLKLVRVHGSGDRRLFAVVRKCYSATVKAKIQNHEQYEGKGKVHITTGLPSGTANAGHSREETFREVGKGIIGIRMTCFKIKRQINTAESWDVSWPIPIAKGRKPKELRDALIWTSHTLSRRFAMFWHPERFAFVLMDTQIVLKSPSVDQETKNRLECMAGETESNKSIVDDATATGQQNDADSSQENQGGFVASLLVRLRGGGPDQEIDTDGYVMGFDLRVLEKTVMGLSLLPMSLEALDHEDFDAVIDWNTVTKHVSEDGSETVEIAPRELPEQSVIDAKKKLLDFCLDSLEQTKKKSGTSPKENAQMKEEILSLEKGADVSAKGEAGKTSLHEASENGHTAIVSSLLGKGVDVNAAGNFGRTPLHEASKNGHEAIVLLLLEKGADVSVKDNYGDSPLHEASLNGNEKIVSLLLEKGADVNAKTNYGATPLHEACMKGNEDVVSLLLEKGADVNAKMDNGVTPLHEACKKRNEFVPSMDTPLHWPSFIGNENVVWLLLDKGADVNAKTNDGDTPLHLACRNRNEDVVSLLLEKGADVNAKLDHGDTLLHRACMKGNEAFVSLLLDRGADVNAKMDDGETPLHRACMKGNEAFVSLLLEKGADVNAKMDNGVTPLHEACMNRNIMYGNEAVVSLLLEKGADVNAKMDNGGTPLHLACMNRNIMYGNEGVISLLLEKGADVNAKMNNGDTPFHWAIRNGNEAVVSLLLEKGADVNAKMDDGDTPLELARRNGHEAIFTLVEKSARDSRNPFQGFKRMFRKKNPHGR
jgi:cytohesin